MRHLSTRSAIYVVIGIGLFILTVSQLRRSDEASNASFVTNSNPFEALKDYQPSAPLAEIGQIQANIVEAESFEAPMLQTPMIRTPMASAPTISFDNVASEMSLEVPATPIETGLEIATNFVNTPQEIEMPEVPEIELPAVPETTTNVQESHYDISFDDTAKPLPLPNDETAPAEELALENALIEPPEIQQSEPAFTERVSTDLPAFSKMSVTGRERIVNNHLASPTENTNGGNRSRSAWKKNPFLKDAPLESSSADVPLADAIATDNLPSEIESTVLSEFTDTSDELSVIANLELEPSSTLPGLTTFPSVDLETMQKVVSESENLDAGSPPIKTGLSESDAQKAVHNIEYGKSLSRRGAAYAARQEFYAALRILAQSHDKQVGGTAYTAALRNGILAIKEAQDFIVTDTEAQIGLSVPNVLETHSTKVISPESAASMTAIEAAQRYFAYASHQLSRSCGQNVVAAEALYCLGKLHSVQAKSGSNDSKLDLAKAMIYHQAAITANGSNFRSLNELGVLYANSGRFGEAKHMLKRSLRIKQLPQAWQNLSVIHQRMGEHQLAQLANREFEMTSTQAPISVIRWTPAEEFNENAPLLQRPVSQASAIFSDSQEAKSATSSLKSLGGRILNGIR